MKKFLALCAASVILFACGSNTNPGIDFLEKAKEAANNGNVELAEQYLMEFQDWASGLSYEETEAVSESIDNWFAENDIYEQLYNLQENDFVYAVEDVSEELDYITDEAVEVTEEVAEEVLEAAEEIIDNLATALETFL